MTYRTRCRGVPSYALDFAGGTASIWLRAPLHSFLWPWAGVVISKGDKDSTWIWNRQGIGVLAWAIASHICVYDSIWNSTDGFLGTGMGLVLQ